ncbi:MAG: sigma-70 family RNA polymerase sigma factor [Armatimonadetes bacterium]|nr:sigma-70 family RNA polymerase sigma factor [Armatimonadota bacterium]
MPNPDVPHDFARVIDENYASIYGLLVWLVGDREAAADLTQDTFVRAYQAWRHFRGESQVSTWLYRIAVNLGRNFLERQSHQRRLMVSLDAPEDEDEARPLELPDTAPGPDGAVTNEELGSLIARELARLRPEQREIIVLRDIQGLSYQEIARILGCSVQAVKSKLFRARSVMRRRLAPYMGWDA